MCWRKVRSRGTGKRKAVDEKEAKYDDDAGQDAPPEPLVHGSFDMLLTLHEVLHGEVQRIQGPDVESGQRGGQWQNDEQNKRTCVIRANSERCDGVDDAKNKVSDSQPANNGHGLAKGGFDNAVAHAYNEQQEEGERVAEGVQDSDDDHEHLGPNVVAVAVLVVVEAPSHEHLDHQEDQDGCDVVLDRKNVVSVLVVKEAPEEQDCKVDDGDAAVEGELRDLRRRELAIRVAERDDGFVLDVFRVGGGSNAVVARLYGQLALSAGDRVVDRLGVVQMDGFRADVHVGDRVGIVGEDPFTLVGSVAELRIDGVVIADVRALSLGQLGTVAARAGSTDVLNRHFRWLAQQHRVLPFPDDDAHGWVLNLLVLVALLEELDEDEGLHLSAPRLLAVHARAFLGVVARERDIDCCHCCHGRQEQQPNAAQPLLLHCVA